MRRNLFWPSDEQWDRIEPPHLPTDVRGVKRAERVSEKLFEHGRSLVPSASPSSKDSCDRINLHTRIKKDEQQNQTTYMKVPNSPLRTRVSRVTRLPDVRNRGTR